MLKITPEGATNAKLKLEGQLVGPWVAELRDTCDRLLRKKRKVDLLVADVDFVDRDGIALLHFLLKCGVSLKGCSPFLQEQLRATTEGTTTGGRDA